MAQFSRRRVCATLLTIGLLQSGTASALGIIQAYEAALQNDPTFRAAVYENEAGQQYKVLGRANLLPSISANYSQSKNKADVTSKTPLGASTTVQRDYTSISGAIQLRQPLVNLESVASYLQGVAQTDYSDAQFAGKTQELILRLATAYVEAKFAEDNLAIAIAQRDNFAELRRVNERMFKNGEATKIDMLDAQAQFDLSEAQVIESRDSVTNARNTLAAIVGQEITALDTLRDDFRVLPMQPARFEEWEAIAKERNPELAAQQYNVEAALQEVNKKRAGHLPRLDLVASISNTGSDTINTFNQDARIKGIGLQLNVPIYSGGYTNALASQALSNKQKAESELEAKTRSVLIELRKNYNQAQSSALRISAQEKAVNSAHILVDAMKKSIRAGLYTNADVLKAIHQLYTTKRDLAQARFGYMLSYLKLRQAAGVLDENSLREVAEYFVSSPN